jgi:hypothetical protein
MSSNDAEPNAIPLTRRCWCAGDSPDIACLIENVSEHGALLRFPERVRLQARFKITSPDDQVTLNCRRKRTSGLTVAVEFIRA